MHSINRVIILSVFIIIGLFPLLLAAQEAPTELDSIRQSISDGDYESAITRLTERVAAESTDAEAYYLLGSVYQYLFQYSGALPYLRKSVSLLPENSRFRFALGKCYYQLDRYSQARRQFEHLVAADSSHLAGGIYLGKIYLKQGKYPEANRIHRRLVKKDPHNSYYHKQLGISALQQDSLRQSSIHLHRALKYNPRDPDLIYHICKINVRAGHPLAAANLLQNAIKDHPENLKLLQLYARVLYETQQYESAIEPFVKLIAMGDSSWIMYQHLGFCYYYADNLMRARDAFKQSFQKDNTRGLTSFFWGLTEKELGNPDKALQLFEITSALAYPGYLPDLYIQLAQSYKGQKRYSEAIQSYKKSMEFAPNKRDILFHLAALYDEYYDDPEPPLQYYRKFLDQTEATKKEYIDYAEQRISKLREEIHFRQ
ncbi:MAG TPA: tetratricopeptide repeat protein [bacterium]|nr:tetratricopeptide repeat protein [bacterium]